MKRSDVHVRFHSGVARSIGPSAFGIVACATGLRIGFPWPHLPWGPYVALVVWSWLVSRSRGPVAAGGFGFLVGLAFYSWNTDYVFCCARAASLSTWEASAAWWAVAMFGGVLLAAESALAYWLVQRMKAPWILATPIVWAGGELISIHLLETFLRISPSLMSLAISQTPWLWISQVGDVGGDVAITWTVSAVSGGIADVTMAVLHWSRRRQRTLASEGKIQSGAPWGKTAAVSAVTLLSVLVAVTSYASWRIERAPEAVGPRVRIIPKPLCHWRVESMLPAHFSAPPFDVVTWPEVAVAGTFVENQDNWAHSFARLARSVGCPIILGTITISADSVLRKFNSAVIICPQASRCLVYHKHFLTPSLEFSPITHLRQKLGIAQMVEAGAPGSQHRLLFESGDAFVVFAVGKQRVPVAPLICNDLLFGRWGRSLLKDHQEVALLVQIANEAVQCRTRAHDLLLACAQLRCIQWRRSLVRCVHGGYSAAIDSFGRIRAVWDGGSISANSAITPALPIDRRVSLFVRCGNSVVGAAILVQFFLIVGRFFMTAQKVPRHA